MKPRESKPTTTALASAESVAERLFRSIRHLATGQGDVRSRLGVVGQTLEPLREKDFPVTLRAADFRWVMNQLTRHEPMLNEGRILATMNRVKNSTGQRIATRIFEIYSKVQDIRSRPLL